MTDDEEPTHSGSGPCDNDFITCQNGGTCVGNTTHTCLCPDGFEPPSCEQAGNGNDAWIAGVVIGIVVVVALIVFVVWRMRNVRHRTKNRSASRLSVNSQTSSSSNEGANGAMVYENVVFEPDGGESYVKYNIPPDFLLQTYHDFASNKNDVADQQFRKELKSAVQRIPYVASVAQHKTNKHKNRFTNVHPFDYNRVKLQSSENDYINASYIEGYYAAKKFIASQGPTVGTVNDFWLMIWQQNSRLIVMLTNPVERGMRKCEQYWPGESGEAKYGKVRVKSLGQTSYPGYFIRKFCVSCAAEALQPVREITQMHFVTWPDHGVPVSTTAFLRLHQQVEKRSKEFDVVSPIVVHCSAGVGRTGTYISFDYLRSEMRETSKVNIFQCVVEMRRQRPEMVQSQAQYVFLHRLLAEMQTLGDTDFESSITGDKLFRINTPGEGGKLAFHIEFEKLELVAPPNFAGVSTFMNKTSSDRSKLRLPPLENQSENVEYDASEIPISGIQQKVVAAKAPTPITVVEFWHAVWHSDTETIVQFPSYDQQSYRYWPQNASEEVKHGEYSVKLLREWENQGIIERKIELSCNSRQVEVGMLQFDGWKGWEFPEPRKLFHLISMVHQRATAEGSVMVQCSDGRGRTGTFLALIEILERIKGEGRVDVLRTVKDLRDLRQGMVETPTQYRFLYEAAGKFIEETSTLYANFTPLVQLDP